MVRNLFSSLVNIRSRHSRCLHCFPDKNIQIDLWTTVHHVVNGPGLLLLLSTGAMDNALLHSSLVGLFYFSVVVILWTLFGGWLRNLWKQLYREPRQQQTRLPDEVNHELQKAARRRIDEEHKTKAADYEERILRPREEARKAQAEKEFRRFTGPAWKGKSRPLGGLSDEGKKDLRKRRDGTSRDAADVRKLPEGTIKTPPPKTEPKPKKVITLPEEPAEGSGEAVTIALRGLTGVKKRRFLKSEKIQVLLDWMAKQGYHPQLYTLFTSYPRRDLSTIAEQHLQDTGITHDMVVFVEERDTS